MFRAGVAGALHGCTAPSQPGAAGGIPIGSNQRGPRTLITHRNLDGNMAIVFPDGNRWTKVPAGTPDRRPKEIKTLSTAE